MSSRRHKTRFVFSSLMLLRIKILALLKSAQQYDADCHYLPQYNAAWLPTTNAQQAFAHLAVTHQLLWFVLRRLWWMFVYHCGMNSPSIPCRHTKLKTCLQSLVLMSCQLVTIACSSSVIWSTTLLYLAYLLSEWCIIFNIAKAAGGGAGVGTSYT